MMDRSRKREGERCYVYTLMGSWKDVKTIDAKDHSVMRVNDEAKQDRTPRGGRF